VKLRREQISSNFGNRAAIFGFCLGDLWLHVLADIEEIEEHERVLVITLLIYGETLLLEVLENWPLINSFLKYVTFIINVQHLLLWVHVDRWVSCVCVWRKVLSVLSVSNWRACYESNLSVQKRQVGRQ
jgi:hypothetical protein